jgi:HAD superfamily hydrolase (TIGR01484 family)
MMQPKLKLISTDFDGTLFAEFERPPIAPAVVSLIAELQQRGAKWVINTGRDMSSLMESLARSNISIQPDYLVIVEREIHRHDGVRYIGDEKWNAACARDHAELFEKIRPEIPALMNWVNSRFRATVYNDEHSPFCLIAGNNSDADVIHARLNEIVARHPTLAVVRNDVYARFCHVEYNKGTALAELTRQLGFTAQDVFATGDHMNDLPMLQLKYARCLAAPANSVEPVKTVIRAQGGFVSSRKCGDGVAEGLEHHLRCS